MQQVIKNRYRIVKSIGQGGMGDVYEAYDRLTSQSIALKQVMFLQNKKNSILQFSDAEERMIVLANEFKTLSSLRHPHIISVLDYGFDKENKPFFTMDLLKDGLEMLDYAIDKSYNDKITYLINVLQALGYLHQRGILHRDLKPANILIADNSPKLLDFGLALDASIAENYESIAGTLSYLAPELLRGKSPSIASDLYAFGIITYELLTGKHPFNTTNQTEFIHQVLLEEPQLDETLLQDNIGFVILRLLSKDADDRYQTAHDTIRALCEATNHPLPIETDAIRDSFLMASTFVGREKELEQLTTALSHMQDNMLQAWLLGGESGVGKSRLMSELRTQALVSGVTVIQGQGVTQAGLPYQLWRDVLPSLLLMSDITDDEALILMTILPNIEHIIERKITDLKTPDNATITMRLPNIIAKLIINAIQENPLLILLEDLQWATDSLDILKNILLASENMPLMIVANYRNDEAPYLKDDLSMMKHLTLPRLTEANIRDLSSAMLGDSGELHTVIELIYKETEGNAFFIVEVMRALAEEAGSLTNIGRVTLPAQVFAGGIQAIIERRVSKLPAWALYPLQVSAIIGRQINPSLLQNVIAELDLDRWLKVCSDVAILSVIETDWQFTHDKIREHMINSVESNQFRDINRQIAQATEALFADTIDEYSPVLAQYYKDADIPEKEAYYAVEATKKLKDFIPLDALKFMNRALKLKAYDYTDNPQETYAELELLNGNLLVILSHFDEAKIAYDKALAIYQSLDNEIGMAKVMTSLGEWCFMTSKLEEAVPYLEQSIPILEKHEEWLYLAYAHMNMATVQNRLGNNESSGIYNQKSYEIALKLKDDLLISKSLNNLAIHHDVKGDWDKALEIHQQALAIRRRIEDKRGIAFSLANMGAIEGDKGNYNLQKQYSEEALLNIRPTGNKRAEANIINMLAKANLKLGNTDLGVSYLKEALSIADRIGEIHLQAQSLFSLADFYRGTDDMLALEYYYDAMERLQKIDVIRSKLHAIDNTIRLSANRINTQNRVKWLCGALNFADNYNGKDSLSEQLHSLKATIEPDAYDSACTMAQNLTIDEILSDMLQNREDNNDS